jgi:acyl-coenzyme A thioesterase PaaI-like protein
MGASIHARPKPGVAHVVIGWHIGDEGRKRFAGSAVYTAEGELVAHARSTWIVHAP